jgi:hypothetical protein
MAKRGLLKCGGGEEREEFLKKERPVMSRAAQFGQAEKLGRYLINYLILTLR